MEQEGAAALNTDEIKHIQPKDVHQQPQNSQPEVHVTSELISESGNTKLDTDTKNGADSVEMADDDYDDESDYGNEHELIYTDEEDDSYVLEPSVSKQADQGQPTMAQHGDESENISELETLDQCVEITEQTLKMVQEMERGEGDDKTSESQIKDEITDALQDLQTDLQDIKKQPVPDAETSKLQDNATPALTSEDSKIKPEDLDKDVKENKSILSTTSRGIPADKAEENLEMSQRTLKLVHEVTPDGKIEKRIRVSDSEDKAMQDHKIERLEDQIEGEEMTKETAKVVELEQPVFGKEMESQEIGRSIVNQIESEVVPDLKAENPQVVDDQLNIGHQEIPKEAEKMSDEPDSSSKTLEQKLAKQAPVSADASETQVPEVSTTQLDDSTQVDTDKTTTITPQELEKETEVTTPEYTEEQQTGVKDTPEPEKEREVKPSTIPRHIREEYKSMQEKKKKEEEAKGVDMSMIIFVGGAVVAIVAMVWMFAYSLGLTS